MVLKRELNFDFTHRFATSYNVYLTTTDTGVLNNHRYFPKEGTNSGTSCQGRF